MGSPPALLGGKPIFESLLPFAQPTRERGYSERALRMIGDSLDSGMLTDGPLVRELEERAAEALGTAYCVAVSSGTVGLMLVLQALDLDGPVLVPSFTFSATAHAVRWNGLEITFADCDETTWCLTPADVTDSPAAVVGVHVSGVPCDVAGLEQAAADVGAELIYDTAHGAGSLVTIEGDRRTLGGFGRAEVFSLTPTKVLSSAEGGLVTTDDSALAAHLRTARNYGNPGDYDTRFAGLNARLSELHAALALLSLEHLEERTHRRNTIAHRYREHLSDVPGVGFQGVPPGTRSSYKDFTITIDPERFGVGRDAVESALQAEGVPTRRYYSPPVHRQAAYRDIQTTPLPVTDFLAERVITLPMFSHLSLDDVDRVAEALRRIQDHADAIEAANQSED
jgi:dTDP-4-amino-4,6-dideoxygalactose transaminase